VCFSSARAASSAAEDAALPSRRWTGSTWRHYRLVTERGGEPTFFLEPDNPDDWPDHFLALGFQPIAHYISAVNSDLGCEDPRLNRIAERLSAQGIRIRPLDPRHAEDDLRRIYAVSAVSFRNNFLYTPIAEADFLAQYRALLPALRPELVLIAGPRTKRWGSSSPCPT
jgi:hypothetical protein